MDRRPTDDGTGTGTEASHLRYDPARTSRHWPTYWLIRHYLLQLGAVLLSFALFFESDYWFSAWSIIATIGVGLLAWRNADDRIGWKWWSALYGMMLATVAFTAIAVYAGPGDTTICSPRHVKPHLWETPKSIGPDPMCQGLLPESVETG
ncbi:hypothetical protein [Parerythrobacter aestuarii]|uniref:hypothetical protein n=1 Tax=Parerythrobacter aestuarii TaxID=3020909 RepID=UPI0024DE5D32|nr:hypothetical protein [Parerythrobacter aestuarii]